MTSDIRSDAFYLLFIIRVNFEICNVFHRVDAMQCACIVLIPSTSTWPCTCNQLSAIISRGSFSHRRCEYLNSIKRRKRSTYHICCIVVNQFTHAFYKIYYIMPTLAVRRRASSIPIAHTQTRNVRKISRKLLTFNIESSPQLPLSPLIFPFECA